ncbi:hypothetical protein DPMN_028931 [Dreissena polymorpha]|uniref:Uncharacterized protein n=1 Tax=Dreissena polymorpha TaxID=45954 RepID=A0A9D4LY83_DREPO|nr:hypothetical protein DPMN_028931 [Dreissena polymorpha]
MGRGIVGAPGLVMGPCIVEIDLNRLKGNFGWVWPMWAGHPRVEIDRIVIRIVQYQLEVNRCRNEEIIVKGNFGWVWPMWVGRLSVGNEAMHIEIDRIVIREFKYQFEVNQCSYEENIVKCNFGWVLSMLAGRPRIDRIVIREVQYQLEVNRFSNEKVNEIVARTDGRTAEITTISPRFSKSVGIKILTLVEFHR